MKSQWLPPTAVIEPFRLISASLLSLLLPLSFLLLSRLSATSASSSSTSFLLDAIPVHLYVVVSSMTISALIHGLTSKITPFSTNLDRPTVISRPRLHLSWILLCVFQISVGLGIQETTMISTGVSEFKIQKDGGFLSKIVFFLGLHETMILWYRSVVKPVVDDTLYGEGYREESMAERVVLAVSCGTLWWWKLRDEIEALVGGNDVNSNNNFEVVDFVNWWLYYLVGTIGMVRVVKGMLWVAMVLLFKRVGRNCSGNLSSTDGHEGGDDDDDDDDDDNNDAKV